MKYTSRVRLPDGSTLAHVAGAHASGWLTMDRHKTRWALYPSLNDVAAKINAIKTWEDGTQDNGNYEARVIEHWLETGL